MARAMHKRVADARRLDYRARAAISFASVDGPACCDSTLHEIDCRVTRIRDNLEDPRVLGGNLVAAKCDPREVRVDTVRRRLFGPQVEQDEILAANRAIVIRS